MIKSPARGECYTILESIGISRVAEGLVLTRAASPIAGNGQHWLRCVWPKECKGVKILFFKYARAKFLDRPGAREVQRVGDPGRARLEPKWRVKWRK